MVLKEAISKNVVEAMLFKHIHINVIESIVYVVDVHVSTANGGSVQALGGFGGLALLLRQVFCICIKTTLGLALCISLERIFVVSLAS